jgi:hypothetical protein
MRMGWSAGRHGVVLGAAAILAMLATFWFAQLRPPMLSSRVMVLVPAGTQVQAQATLARSNFVLDTSSLMVGQLDRRQVHVVVSSPTTLTITVTAKTAAQAQGAANAVAHVYVARASPPGAPGGQKRAAAGLYNATPATGTSVSVWVAQTAGFGTLVGFVLGVIAAFALVRPRRAS